MPDYKKEIVIGVVSAVTASVITFVASTSFDAGKLVLGELQIGRISEHIISDPALSKQLASKLVEESGELSSSVIAFNSEECPKGWEPYQLAYGRVVRGIDIIGDTDPEGKRMPGSIQEDSMQDHHHGYTRMNFPENDQGQPNKSEDNDGRIVGKNTTGVRGARSNPAETRSKNVALLYCERK